MAQRDDDEMPELVEPEGEGRDAGPTQLTTGHRDDVTTRIDPAEWHRILAAAREIYPDVGTIWLGRTRLTITHLDDEVPALVDSDGEEAEAEEVDSMSLPD